MGKKQDISSDAGVTVKKAGDGVTIFIRAVQFFVILAVGGLSGSFLGNYFMSGNSSSARGTVVRQPADSPQQQVPQSGPIFTLYDDRRRRNLVFVRSYRRGKKGRGRQDNLPTSKAVCIGPNGIPIYLMHGMSQNNMGNDTHHDKRISLILQAIRQKRSYGTFWGRKGRISEEQLETCRRVRQSPRCRSA